MGTLHDKFLVVLQEYILANYPLCRMCHGQDFTMAQLNGKLTAIGIIGTEVAPIQFTVFGEVHEKLDNNHLVIGPPTLWPEGTIRRTLNIMYDEQLLTIASCIEAIDSQNKLWGYRMLLTCDKVCTRQVQPRRFVCATAHLTIVEDTKNKGQLDYELSVTCLEMVTFEEKSKKAVAPC
ncbi:hypothetical protein R3P38DRAFT_3216033 [Favolaschia claudopus]|uniref:Uncharacterized protein n=1 Tax=Favolaschia claudopus TaxID=2862362 RepID=A0AAW0A695_9AGAR